jgi:hypothetical protein
MTTPSITPDNPNGTISMSDVINEINSGTNSGGSHNTFNDGDVRELAGEGGTSSVDMNALRGKTWIQAAGSSTFYGSGTFYPPRGYSSITLKWPQAGGLTSISYSVSYGTPVTVTIGGAGEGSTFGTHTTPAFDTEIFYNSSAIDGVFNCQFGLFTDYVINLSYYGLAVDQDDYYYDPYGEGYYYRGVIQGFEGYARDRGVTFQVTNESSHGYKIHSLRLNTIANNCVNPYGYEVYKSYLNGRDQVNNSFSISNGIVYTGVGDGYNDEAGYNYSVGFRQSVFVIASWG